MKNVVFVAPFFLRATLQFIHGVARLPGVKLAVISRDPVDNLPLYLREKTAAHCRLEDPFNPENIAHGVRLIEKDIGPVERVLGALEQLQIPLAEVRERLGLPGMLAPMAANFRDKSRMKDVLRDHEIPCARHYLARSPEQALAFADEVGFPLIVKPPDGSGSRNTFRINDDQEMGHYLAAHKLTPSSPSLLEEFIMGAEYTFDSVFVRGRMVWHSITRYFPSPLQAMKNPSIQWCVLTPREIGHPYFDDIRAIAERALKALGMETGLSHLEWFRRTDGSIAISEVGARPPGGQITSMHGYACDFDIHWAWARLMVFDRFDPPKREYAAGAVFLRGLGPGRVAAIEGLDRTRNALGPIIVEEKTPAIGQSASGSYEGEGYLIVRHPETSVVEKALDYILNTVRVRMA